VWPGGGPRARLSALRTNRPPSHSIGVRDRSTTQSVLGRLPCGKCVSAVPTVPPPLVDCGGGTRPWWLRNKPNGSDCRAQGDRQARAREDATSSDVDADWSSRLTGRRCSTSGRPRPGVFYWRDRRVSRRHRSHHDIDHRCRVGGGGVVRRSSAVAG
jgi:hypothetical protein